MNSLPSLKLLPVRDIFEAIPYPPEAKGEIPGCLSLKFLAMGVAKSSVDSAEKGWLYPPMGW